MDGFFGIGFGELVMIAIVALVVLGPERLPGALREVAKFVRMIRNLSNEFTSQFGDEFKALDDLNPRRILKEAIDSIDEEEEAKTKAQEKTKPAVKSATANKSTTAKPTTAKSTTNATTTSTSTPKPTTGATTTKPASVAKAKDVATTAEVAENDATGSASVAETIDTDANIANSDTTPVAVNGTEMVAAQEHQIAPPKLVESAETAAQEPASATVQSNGHASAEVVPGTMTDLTTAIAPEDEKIVTRSKPALGETDPNQAKSASSMTTETSDTYVVVVDDEATGKVEETKA